MDVRESRRVTLGRQILYKTQRTRTKLRTDCLFHCDREGVVVERDESAQVWTDLARRLKTGQLGRSFLIGCAYVLALCVLLEITKAPYGEHVPRRSLIF